MVIYRGFRKLMNIADKYVKQQAKEEPAFNWELLFDIEAEMPKDKRLAQFALHKIYSCAIDGKTVFPYHLMVMGFSEEIPVVYDFTTDHGVLKILNVPARRYSLNQGIKMQRLPSELISPERVSQKQASYTFEELAGNIWLALVLSDSQELFEHVDEKYHNIEDVLTGIYSETSVSLDQSVSA